MTTAATPLPISDILESPSWDYRGVRRQVRERAHTLTDRIDRLMRVEGTLSPKLDALRGRISALGISIATVEQAGGDATKLREQADDLAAKLAPAEAEFGALAEEMRLVRASLKWADSADSALHWLCFAEPQLDRFDHEAASKAREQAVQS